MEKINNPTQIKSAERETILSDFQSSGLTKFILDFSQDMILSILKAEGKPAKSSEQGKGFVDAIEKEKLEARAKLLAPIYLERLQEMGFPDKEIDIKTHQKEVKKLLKKRFKK